jgi:putative intracellular protease/amidase
MTVMHPIHWKHHAVGRIPYYLETALKERGATYTSAPVWQPNVVVSGRLVTGQNPASAKGVAEAVVGIL